MSNVLTDWRTALVTLLGTTFPSAEVVSGEPPTSDTVQRDKDRVWVWTGPLVADTRDVNDARPRMMIRYLKAQNVLLQNKQEPPDPAPIEQLMLDLAGMLQPKLTTLGVASLAYFHVDSITPDYRDDYGAEVQLTGWMRNPMETGG